MEDSDYLSSMYGEVILPLGCGGKAKPAIACDFALILSIQRYQRGWQ